MSVHYGGKFVLENEKQTYIGGKVMNYDNYQVNKMNLERFKDLAILLGMNFDYVKFY